MGGEGRARDFCEDDRDPCVGDVVVQHRKTFVRNPFVAFHNRRLVKEKHSIKRNQLKQCFRSLAENVRFQRLVLMIVHVQR